MAEEKFNIEEAFETLDQMIERLESDEVSLKESLQIYGEGAELLARCKEELTGIEKEMMIIGEKMEQGEQEDAF